MNKKQAVVLGAGGFIGGHLVKKLKSEGYWVRGVDIKNNEYHNYADEFILGDLTNPTVVQSVIPENADEVYQLAADMGGALYIFTGQNDANVMHNSALVNLNVVHECTKKKVKKVFYSSSACIYPEHNQMDPDNPNCEESSAYPAGPDSEYGWEKLFSERLYMAFHRNHGLECRIARFHNIYGVEGTWQGGREKAPAAICRKIAKLKNSDQEIEVWGDGLQTRSFLYVADCIEATRRLMKSNFMEPINIGSEEMVTINELIDIVAEIASKPVKKKHKLDAPTGVRGRNSDNRLIRSVLHWDFEISLRDGLKDTYHWINNQISKFDS